MWPRRRPRPRAQACVAAAIVILAGALLPGAHASPVWPRAPAPGQSRPAARAAPVPVRSPDSLAFWRTFAPTTPIARTPDGPDIAPARHVRPEESSYRATPHRTLVATSTQWVTATEHLDSNRTQVSHVPSGWLPPKRTAWYQRKAMFMSSFFLAVFIVLLIGAMVTLYDRDHTLDVDEGMAEEDAVEYILRSRLQREQEKAQHDHEDRNNRRDRWRRLRSRTTSVVSSSFHQTRRREPGHLLHHHHGVSRFVGHSRVLQGELRPGFADHHSPGRSSSRCTNSSSPSPSRASQVLGSMYGSVSDILSRSYDSSGPELLGSGSAGFRTRGGDVRLTQEDSTLAQRYILQKIAALQAELAEWNEIQGQLSPTPNAGTSAPHPDPGFRALQGHASVHVTAARCGHARSRRGRPMTPSPGQDLELCPPAYLPTNLSTTNPSGQASKSDSALTHEASLVASRPAEGRVTMAHVATDEKVVLSALRLGRSAPTSVPSPRINVAASAPPLHLQLEVPPHSGKGKESETSGLLPRPSHRVEPVYNPFPPSGELFSKEKNSSLGLLLGGRSMPSAPQASCDSMRVAPSAPPLDLGPPSEPGLGSRTPGTDL